jgi:hypothetical protein
LRLLPDRNPIGDRQFRATLIRLRNTDHDALHSTLSNASAMASFLIAVMPVRFIPGELAHGLLGLLLCHGTAPLWFPLGLLS